MTAENTPTPAAPDTIVLSGCVYRGGRLRHQGFATEKHLSVAFGQQDAEAHHEGLDVLDIARRYAL